MTPQISIIVPIYNREKYLRRCLHSMYNSRFTNIEIICINDCSSDSSLEILQDCAHRDPRVVIVDLPENRGEGGARNAGLAIAKGKYIGFVDSDDTVDDGFYGTLYAEAENSGADIVEAPIKCIDTVGVGRELPHATWFCSSLFRSDFLRNNSILFPAMFSCGEDIVFMVRVLMASPNRKKINNTYYNYHQIPTSASQHLDDRKSEDLISAFSLAFHEIEQRVYSSQLSEIYAKNIFCVFFQHFLTAIDLKITAKAKYHASDILFNLYSNYSYFEDANKFLQHSEPVLLDILKKDDVNILYNFFLAGKHRLAERLRNRIKLQR